VFRNSKVSSTIGILVVNVARGGSLLKRRLDTLPWLASGITKRYMVGYNVIPPRYNRFINLNKGKK